MKRFKIVLCGFIFGVCITAFGDSPGLPTTKDETVTVALTQATVDIELGPEHVLIESRFVFVNEGSAGDVDIYLPLSFGWEYVGAEPDGVRDWLAEEYGDPVSYSEVGGAAYVEYALAEIETDSGAESEYRYVRNEDAISDGPFFSPYPKSFRKTFSVKAGSEKPSAELLTEIEVPFDELRTYLYQNVYTRTYARFTVRFSAGEERVVTCRYWSEYYESWTLRIPPTFIYSLGSGEVWAGPIGELTVRVKRSLKTADGPIWFSSPVAVVEVNDDTEIITWKLENYEPPGEERVLLYVGFPLPSFTGYRLETFCEGAGVDAGYGVPGYTTVDNLNFRTGPSPGAKRVAGIPTLKEGTKFTISEASGEWWRLRLTDGTEGWIRWRYVDPDTGEEFVYASFVD